MLGRFATACPPDGDVALPTTNLGLLKQVPGLAELLAMAAGCAFGDGILRVFTEDEARRSQSLVNAMFPEWAVRIRPFAQDWLGRQYALDLHRNAMLILLNPGSGGVYELDGTIPELLDRQMVDAPDIFRAQDLFGDWRAVRPERTLSGMCVGFKTPLFLGGDEAVENLEVIAEVVYWSIQGQLWTK